MRQDIMEEPNSLGFMETRAMYLLVKRKSPCVTDKGMLHICISTPLLVMIHHGFNHIFILQLDLHAASQNQLEGQHAGLGVHRKTHTCFAHVS